MDILPLGSIVQLRNGNRKIMIISRVPLYNDQGKIGYFDYAGCLYPNGQTGQETLFFNQEDIQEIYFRGFVDEAEEDFQQVYKEKIKEVTYPKLKIVGE